MKRYERELLNNLHTEASGNNHLDDLKSSMGSLRYVKGNPLTKTEITIQVTKNYFADGVAILPAALPVALQTPLPSYIFGLTDYYSGYAKGLNIIKPFNPWTCISGQGEIIGAELLPGGAAGWTNPAWWFLAGADWAQAVDGVGTLFLQCNGAGVAPNLISNAIFRTGHKYRITSRILNAPYSAARYITMGDVFTIARPENFLNHDYTFYQQDFVSMPNPVNAPLRVQSDTFACDLYSLSVREITGYENFKGEPALGIFGLTKNVVFSTNVERGDLVITYAANPYPSGVTYTAEVIVHCNNIPYGTFLNSFVSDLITINTLRYSVPVANINQFVNPVSFIYQTLFGKINTADVDPRNYITNTDFQQQICDIPISLPIDKNIILSIPMNFDCTNYSLLLFVEKVDPLTNMPKQLNYKNNG